MPVGGTRKVHGTGSEVAKPLVQRRSKFGPSCPARLTAFARLRLSPAQLIREFGKYALGTQDVQKGRVFSFEIIKNGAHRGADLKLPLRCAVVYVQCSPEKAALRMPLRRLQGRYEPSFFCNGMYSLAFKMGSPYQSKFPESVLSDLVKYRERTPAPRNWWRFRGPVPLRRIPEQAPRESPAAQRL